MRGEQSSHQYPVKSKDGSSPHAWGTDHSTGSMSYCFRFIPTCVGNSSYIASQPCTQPVHPHMRGEQFLHKLPGKLHGGSSPHAWGTDLKSGLFHLSRLVHPHMRGEQIHRHLFCLSHHGSSPHAWGTDALSGPHWNRRRFIPTCVGNRIIVNILSCRKPVHPHMRGEQTRNGMTLWAIHGSSPHAWGTGRGRRSPSI